jgi:hypothetical protein
MLKYQREVIKSSLESTNHRGKANGEPTKAEKLSKTFSPFLSKSDHLLILQIRGEKPLISDEGTCWRPRKEKFGFLYVQILQSEQSFFELPPLGHGYSIRSSKIQSRFQASAQQNIFSEGRIRTNQF